MVFAEAISLARAGIKDGSFSAFCVENHILYGRQIIVESDQGIHPDPLWREYEVEEDDRLCYV